ncbi:MULTISPECIES: hypothetical protein [unclassified Roseovarius]|uniref:hypothetical protein n=1 Tax=unclassified Roseovarius TaxID=2614913 RepID=UPI00273E556B|nr:MULTISPECIES: hypothetical protein [unclassified Roseovarius]
MAMAVFFVLFTTALIFGIRFGADYRRKETGSKTTNFFLGLGKVTLCQFGAVAAAGLFLTAIGAGNTFAELVGFSIGVTIQSAFLFVPVFGLAFFLAPKFKKRTS